MLDDGKDTNTFHPANIFPEHTKPRPERPIRTPFKGEPFRVPAVEVDEVSGLDAAGAGQPAAGGAAQRAALHRHVQTLGVVHRLHHGAARPGRSRVWIVGAVGQPANRVRAASWGERREPH